MSPIFWLLWIGLLLVSVWSTPFVPVTITSAEAQIAFAIDDTSRSPTNPRETLRYVRDSVLSSWALAPNGTPARIQTMLLDGWQLVVGDADVLRRWLSLLLSTIALVALVRLVSGEIALGLFAMSAYFFLDASQSFDGLMLIITTSLLALLSYRRWQQKPSLWRNILYCLSTLLAVIVFWPIVLLVVGQVALAVRQGNISWRSLLISYSAVAAATTAWISLLLLSDNLLPLIDLTPARTLSWLIFLVIALIWFYGRRLAQQQRYLLLLVLVIFQSSVSLWLFSNSPQWQAVTAELAQQRQPLDPLVLLTPPDHPASYYAAETPFDAGIALRLGWQALSSQMLSSTLAALDEQTRIWLVAEQDVPITQVALDRLASDRRILYQVEIDNTLIVQFDHVSDEAAE